MQIPWKIATQAITLTAPDGTPLMNLQFLSDINEASTQRLRIVPVYPEGAGKRSYDTGDGADPEADVIELEFNTGGLLIGKPYFQPRYLKPYERPNLGNPNVRRNVEWRKENWKRGQAGENALPETEWNTEWDKAAEERAKQDGVDVAAQPVATPESIKAAEEKAVQSAAAQQAVRNIAIARGEPVSPAPHLETPAGANVVQPPPMRPDEGQPGTGVITDDPDPVRANKARAGAVSPQDGPDPVNPQGVTTTQTLKPGVAPGLAPTRPVR